MSTINSVGENVDPNDHYAACSMLRVYYATDSKRPVNVYLLRELLTNGKCGGKVHGTHINETWTHRQWQAKYMFSYVEWIIVVSNVALRYMGIVPTLE